ncbi:ABZJ_00895 family protein [Phyllobacterium sp. OV277]|uniref:ABZJ_00895 family protein n=1 Tax=Phyllobacterium sp. OV277 TaxID=1882772 RepID=UPI00087E03E1|nr:ABZJ_00895 family protein [Phyllobacterium sp. OV277]SDP77853.1 hypothetical protein SAMN05443582_1104 [Phyllobacterium sp. OV277]
MSSSPVQTSLAPIFVRFIFAFVLCVIFVQVITTVLKFDIPSSMSIITLVVALAPAFDLFTRTTGRVMTSGEKLRFSLGAAIITIVINVATLLLMSYIATGSLNLDTVTSGVGLGRIDTTFVAIILAGSLVLAFIITYFTAGFMGRGALKRLAKAKE